MNLRALVLMVVSAFVACATNPPRAAPGPRKRDIGSPPRRLQFPGFSVAPPSGPRWVIVPSMPANEGPVSVIVAFGRRPDPAGRPQDAHTVLATVATRDLRRTFSGADEYLRFEESETAPAIARMASARHRVISAITQLDPRRGANCVKYDYAVEDTGLPGANGEPFTFALHGYRCLHPRSPRYSVDVGYSERYRSGGAPLDVAGEVAPFLDGFAFTDEPPVHVTTIPLGGSPQALTFADGSVWVAYGDHDVARIDPATSQIVARIAVGRDPVGIASGNEGIWAVARGDAAVVRIDPKTNRVAQSIPIGGKPLQAAAAAGSVWVTNEGSGEVVRADAATGRVVARIPIGKEASGIAAGSGAVWATAFRDGKLVRIDPRTNQVTQSIDVGLLPGEIAVDDASVWVANQWDLTVSRVDPSSGKVVAVVPLYTRPSGIAFGPGGLWVTNYDEGDVSRIDVANNRVVGEPIPVGKRPVLLRSGAGALWVSNAWGGSVSRIDL
jgi:DNA-binding beta-propeller fold protein YncE